MLDNCYLRPQRCEQVQCRSVQCPSGSFELRAMPFRFVRAMPFRFVRANFFVELMLDPWSAWSVCLYRNSRISFSCILAWARCLSQQELEPWMRLLAQLCAWYSKKLNGLDTKGDTEWFALTGYDIPGCVEDGAGCSGKIMTASNHATVWHLPGHIY